MAKIIGVTGGYCAGKNQAADIVSSLGFHVVDVDALGHQALEASAERLAQVFGPWVLDENGKVDRKALGAHVFSDPAQLRLHESIVHPAMLALLDGELVKDRLTCVNAALLYRFPQVARCELVLEIRASLPVRIWRGIARDKLSIFAVVKRIARQRYLWKLRPLLAPEIAMIWNNGSLETLRKNIVSVLEAR